MKITDQAAVMGVTFTLIYGGMNERVGMSCMNENDSSCPSFLSGEAFSCMHVMRSIRAGALHVNIF